MGRDVTLWTERLRTLVADGPVERAVAEAEMAALVPPGRAFRDTERVVQWVRDKHQYKSTREYADEEQLKDRRISSGQKRIVRSAIWTQIKHGRIKEYQSEQGVRMLMKGPNAWDAPEAPAEEA